MNKRISTTIVALGLAGGSIIGGASLANAQYGGDDPPQDPAPTEQVSEQGLQAATDDAVDGEDAPQRGNRGNRRGNGYSEAVTEVLGLTSDEVRAARSDGQTLADVAAEQGVTIEALTDAMSADKEARIAEKLAAGEITEEQAADKLAELEQRVTDHVNGIASGNRDGGRRGVRGNSEVVTDLLGLTGDEIREARSEGQSLAAVAAEQGVSVDALVDAIAADKQERIAEKVAAGDLTDAEAAEKLAELEQRINDKVNRTPGEG